MNDERGQALVELALVLPVLLVLAFAITEIAELGIARLALEQGAAEGARIGALTNDDDLIRSSVSAAVAPLDPAKVAVTVEPVASDRGPEPRGALLRVRLRYAIAAPLGFIGLPQVVVRGDAARRIEWTP
jgi:hypothetical protein